MQDLMDGGVLKTEKCPFCGGLRPVGATCGACGRDADPGTGPSEAAVSKVGAPLPARPSARVRSPSTPIIALATVGTAVVGLAALALYLIFASGVGDVVTASSPQATLFRADVAGAQADLSRAHTDLQMALAPLPELDAVDQDFASGAAATFTAIHQEWTQREAPGSLEEAYRRWMAALAGLAEVGALVERGLAAEDPGLLYDAQTLLGERYVESSQSAELLLVPEGS